MEIKFNKQIKYKGTKLEDSNKGNRRYRVLEYIKSEYGSLLNFLKDIELEFK